ncbi:MAG: hypothetical protein A2428_14170 [Bdellovibrionales bacterium RIFOXYC1_FULL_54_43]|nr:MAG: hypothetical protein A2428_14170 [Bdellovibrionales bacterium RIFOXYC1_FULL_54_43]OFZ81196.1 MAG: hypothetical protein A2603_09560 [Bdellovibrionales bacterium RIFOXYD1_FULL_55_31]
MRPAPLPRILIIYTGGTFGMNVSPSRSGARLSVPRLSPQSLARDFRKQVPELAQIANCEVSVLMNRDSAHLGPPEWCKIADRIRSTWKNYRGVVILHGTDTLAYTASALSFLLRPCLKPVVLTGAQRPLSALRNDARRNLVSAVEIASAGPRPLANQVSVFFDDELLQGNRVHKRSATDYHAFESPHIEALALVGTEIRYRSAKPFPRSSHAPVLIPQFNPKVALIHVTPGFPAKAYSAHLLEHLEGIVLNVFPSGTAPTHDPEFVKFLRTARRRKLPVIVVTEGGSNADPNTYEAGRALLDEGCIWAGDMTTECCFVKASLLLGQPHAQRDFEKLWKIRFAGEAG